MRWRTHARKAGHPQLMDTERPGRRRCLLDGERRLSIPKVASRMTFEQQPAGEIDRSAALDGWVAAFDREMEQSGDFATSVAAMTAHGCFDVRAVVERWILANPTGNVTVAQLQPAVQEPAPRVLVLEEAPVVEVAAAPRERALDAVPASPRPEVASSPDIGVLPQFAPGRNRARADRRGLPGIPARDRRGGRPARGRGRAATQRRPPSPVSRGSQ